MMVAHKASHPSYVMLARRRKLASIDGCSSAVKLARGSAMLGNLLKDSLGVELRL